MSQADVSAQLRVRLDKLWLKINLLILLHHQEQSYLILKERSRP
jgi:hypothetical protein